MKKVLANLFILFVISGANAFCQTGNRLFTNHIGIQAYTYRNSFPKNITATLDTIKTLGITEMEGPDPKNSSSWGFMKQMADRNIRMTSIGVDYGLMANNPDSVIRLARFWRVNYVMVAWIPHGKTFTLTDAKKAVDDFNRSGMILKLKGITLCYHDHGYEFGKYQDGTLFDYIAKNTNPLYLSFEMDVLWAFHGGADPAKLLYKYKGRWKLLHLKDIRKGVANDLTGGTDTKNDVALGTGQINIPEVLKAAKAVGIKHYYIEDESPNHAAQIPVSIAYLKSLKE